MAACSTRKRCLGLALILAAALRQPALPGAFAGARSSATSSARRSVSARAAAGRELPFELTREEKELYYNSGKSGDGVSTVYHFTTQEAARSIWEQQTFRVSRDIENDAVFGFGVYAAPLSGEEYTDLQMAQQNFGGVTGEALAKSACYFRITVDSARVQFSGKEGRLVLLVEPGSRGASEIRWSELEKVEGPFFTKRDPAATLIQECAERLAQERGQSCREQVEGFAGQTVTTLAAAFFASIIFGVFAKRFGWVTVPAFSLLMGTLFTFLFRFIEVPLWLWLQQAEEACVQTFRLPREAAGEAPELGKAAAWLFFTWFPRIAVLNAAADHALSVGTPLANTTTFILLFVNVWFVAECTRTGPYNDMVTRLQQAAEEAYIPRLSQPKVLAQLRPGMGPADLERLLSDEEKEWLPTDPQ